MKAAVVYFASRQQSPIVTYARALAKGIESQGHQVDIIDGIRDQNKKLTIYQYIALGTEQISLFGKITPQIRVFLASTGTVQGKRAFAFVAYKIIGASRALLRLMNAMEKEGMLIKFSEIITSETLATEVGRRLHMDR